MTTSDDSKISEDRREALRYAFAIGGGAALASALVTGHSDKAVEIAVATQERSRDRAPIVDSKDADIVIEIV